MVTIRLKDKETGRESSPVDIEEAIEYLKGTWIGYCELDCEWFEEVQHKLLSILERGKE